MTDTDKQRMTSQRLIILEELRKTKSHPTADQIFSTVREKLPNISLGTVYRNLEMMTQNGSILKLDFGDGKMRFDGDTAEHYHIYCIQCGKVVDMPGEAFGKIRIDHSMLQGFTITRKCIHLFGICPECTEKENL